MKKFVAIFLVCIMLFTTVFASSAQNELDKTKKDIAEQKDKLDDIKQDKKDTLTEIDNIDRKISSTESTISSLEDEIEDLEKNISVTEDNIDYMQKQFDVKNEVYQKRTVSYYETGTSSYWEILFTSDSMADFMHRKQLLDDAMEFDRNLLEEIKEEKSAIESQKEALENDKVLCENKKAEAEEKKQSLSDTKKVRTEYLADLTTSEKTLSDSIDKLQKQADALVAQINAASSKGTQYTGGTMTWPLPGYYTITSPFGNRLHPVLKVYKMHTGIDIAGSGCNGKTVVAAADGTVITAGWISGYGNTVVIDHGGGVTTLYGHSQKLLVTKGQKVTKGQAIMLVGMTGYATGPHLHFEIRENGKYINPVGGKYLKQ